MAAENALEIARAGRLGSRWSTPFDVAHADPIYQLRRYRGAAGGPPILLVPPLMVTSEVYDIDAELSGVAALTGAGVDTWLVDFGAPERAEGGMARTLDDHVRAVADSVAHARQVTGRDVHLCGYSQGGMFAYQAAALLRSTGIASVITFGSPVDLHATLSVVPEGITQRLVGVARAAISLPLDRVTGLPGRFTSTGFKMLSARKEVQQFVDFVRKLHDRQALEQREPRRLFLGGEGFVAWPGPALRTFIDEVIVANRMASGGMVIDGRTVTLADIRCPVLCFYGTRDTMGRPAAVRAIRDAAPAAEVHEVKLRAGHFGLVVGSTAQTVTWPTTAAWIHWREGKGARPKALGAALSTEPIHDEDYDRAFDGVGNDLELLRDVAGKGAAAGVARLGEVAREIGGGVANARWQVPRLARMRRLRPQTRVSLARTLADQARAIPDKTFFLWRGRAFTYADANRRVDAIVRGLIAAGVRSGMRVAMLMDVRPSYLSLIGALSRLRATAVLISPRLPEPALTRCLELGQVEAVIADPDQAARARASFSGPVLVLGGGPPGAAARSGLPDGVVDLEAIDPSAVTLPAWYRPDRGRADDLAMVIFTAGADGEPRAARISNRRWAASAYGAAAACTLTPRDTVYCCVPLHHMAGALVAAGGALVGGARLALAASFRADQFWDEARRYGATVVFYAGDMCRALVDAPTAPGERNHPVRLFAGSGMRIDVWRRLIDRFGPLGVLEFYASTEGNALLANAAGDKVGALGRPMPGSSELALVDWDHTAGAPARDAGGRGAPTPRGQPGMLVARIDELHPLPGAAAASRVARDLLAPGDTWYLTGDIMRRDRDGDYWLVDRAADMVLTAAGPVSSIQVEDALHRIPEVAQAAVYPAPGPDGHPVPAAAVVLRPGTTLDPDRLRRALEPLPPHARLELVRPIERMPTTAGYRPLKSALRS